MELPTPGSLVAIDAEFVSMQQVRLAMNLLYQRLNLGIGRDRASLGRHKESHPPSAAELGARVSSSWQRAKGRRTIH